MHSTCVQKCGNSLFRHIFDAVDKLSTKNNVTALSLQHQETVWATLSLILDFLQIETGTSFIRELSKYHSILPAPRGPLRLPLERLPLGAGEPK